MSMSSPDLIAKMQDIGSALKDASEILDSALETRKLPHAYAFNKLCFELGCIAGSADTARGLTLEAMKILTQEDKQA